MRVTAYYHSVSVHHLNYISVFPHFKPSFNAFYVRIASERQFMKNFTLTPYSSILLAVMALIAVVFLILCLRSFLFLQRTLKDQHNRIDLVERNLRLAYVKAEVLSEDHEEKKKKDHIAKMLIPALLAIRSVYDMHDNYHGFKGYRKAARDVFFGDPEEKFRRASHIKG